jgi:pimeloyl-ACP methyl ester carboxylesterase
MDDVLVLLPGILGSALERDGERIWDIGLGAFGHMLNTFGGSLQKLEVRPDDARTGAVRATGLLSSEHMVPLVAKNVGYEAIAGYLLARLRLTRGENFFEFPYDWRLDNAITAERLQACAAGWLDQRRRTHPKAQLVLVAHSMGGLVCRHFIEVLGGWRDTRMLVTLGTPHRGSVKALHFLANGMRFQAGPVPLLDLTRVLHSMPSVYQLLPIYPCIDGDGPELRKIEHLAGDSLGGMKLDLAREGIEFHRRIEAAVERNRRDPAYRTRLVPVVGVHQPTYLSARRTSEGVEPLRTLRGETLLEGDGTVPRLSATPIEMSDTPADTFVACPHASLQNFDPVRVQLRAAVQDVPLGAFRKVVDTDPVGLDVDDAYSAAQPVRAHARCVGREKVRATVCSLATGEETSCALRPLQPGTLEIDAGRLAPGAYRLHLEPAEDETPLDDVFTVLEAR